MTNLEGIQPEFYAQGETFISKYQIESTQSDMENVSITFSFHEQMVSQSYRIKLANEDVTSQYSCSETTTGKRNIICFFPVLRQSSKFEFEHRVQPLDTLYGTYNLDVEVSTPNGYNANKESSKSLEYNLFTSKLVEATRDGSTNVWKALNMRKGSKNADIADVAYLDIPSDVDDGTYIIEVTNPVGKYFKYGFQRLSLEHRIKFSEDSGFPGYIGKTGLLVPSSYVQKGKRIFFQFTQYASDSSRLHSMEFKLRKVHDITSSFTSQSIPAGEASYYRLVSPSDISRFVKIVVKAGDSNQKLSVFLKRAELPAYFVDGDILRDSSSFSDPFTAKYDTVTDTSQSEFSFYIMVLHASSSCDPNCKHSLTMNSLKPLRVAPEIQVKLPLDEEGQGFFYLDYDPTSLIKYPDSSFLRIYQDRDEESTFISGNLKLIARSGMLPEKISYDKEISNFTVSSTNSIMNYKMKDTIHNYGQSHWYFRIQASKNRVNFVDILQSLVVKEDIPVYMSKPSETVYNFKMLEQRSLKIELRSASNGIFTVSLKSHNFQPGIYLQTGDEVASKDDNAFSVSMGTREDNKKFIFIRESGVIIPFRTEKLYAKRSLLPMPSQTSPLHANALTNKKTNIISLTVDSSEYSCTDYNSEQMSKCVSQQFDVTMKTNFSSFSTWNDDASKNIYEPAIPLQIFKIDNPMEKVTEADGSLVLELTQYKLSSPNFDFEYRVIAGPRLADLLDSTKTPPFICETDGQRSSYYPLANDPYSLKIRKVVIPKSKLPTGSLYVLVEKPATRYKDSSYKYSVYTYVDGTNPPEPLHNGGSLPPTGFFVALPWIIMGSLFGCCVLVVCIIFAFCFCICISWRIDVRNKRRFKRSYEKNLKYRKERDEKNKRLLENESSSPFSHLSSEQASPIPLSDQPSSPSNQPPTNQPPSNQPSSNQPPTSTNPSNPPTSNDNSNNNSTSNNQTNDSKKNVEEPKSFTNYVSDLLGGLGSAWQRGNSGYVQFGNFDSSTGTFSSPSGSSSSFSARTHVNNSNHLDSIRRSNQMHNDNIRRMNDNIRRSNQIHNDNIRRMNDNIHRQNQAMHQRIHQQNMARMHNNIHRPPPPPVFRPPPPPPVFRPPM
eukprot:CAMPEP_0117419550 /NCGR_PEP_ID=MMETSP0758-20121206/1084_1 /TAXON_ID=63605 /ORGANISM="Percolomonas cosmopolitus, Strain AE-1 (ATCC 50343)" /LENGTH=1112 /DNA_ID=CAMNT_0005200671 /DNA_START=589 /DNA_END=3927 /DNA_ORIENTATION=-